MKYQFIVGFFSSKTMGIIKINFGHCVGKYSSWYFCAGIGPLQPGVVLFFLYFQLTIPCNPAYIPLTLSLTPQGSGVGPVRRSLQVGRSHPGERGRRSVVSCV